MKLPLSVLAAALVTGTVAAQTLPAPQNVLQYTATATVEVPQDVLVMTLSTTREGSDAGTVQGQLKAALEAALTEARKSAQPGQMDVRTGNFQLYPRYSQAGKIGSWQGSAELVLEGRDFARIAQVAGKVQGLTVAGSSFALSREQRAKAETDAQALAIDRFRAKGQELARSFGFTGYTMREVSVNTSDAMPIPRMRMQAAEMRASSDSPVPVEAGKASVSVTVSGSVQLR